MFLWRVLVARLRLVMGVAIGLLVLFGQFVLAEQVRPIIAWDVGVLAYLILAYQLFFTGVGPEIMAKNAAAQEEGEWTLFVLEVGATAASFAVIVSEFAALKGLEGQNKGLHLALVGVTLLLSWLMTQTTFAFRYAHEYYEASPDGTGYRQGLDFPSEKHPDYLDFAYFAMVIGMTFQVSDVQISDRHLRRLAMLHGLVAFLFNTIILALTVNLVAGLV